jgi:hypothetical protein
MNLEDKMSKPKGVMHQVAVKATKDGAGDFHFKPESEVWHDSHGHFAFHKDKHGMKKHDYHLVEFVIDDRTNDGLKFPSVPHDAMWVARVDDQAHPICPDKDTASDYEVIEPICVCDGGERLIVRNHNPRSEQWAFTLNFVKDGAAQADANMYISWDPIIQNQNGGRA